MHTIIAQERLHQLKNYLMYLVAIVLNKEYLVECLTLL